MEHKPNPTPKERFQCGKDNIGSHHALTESPSFERAFDVGMLEYCRLLSNGVSDSQSAMSAGFKLQGAIEFAAQVKNLAEQHTPPPRRADRDNLQAFDLSIGSTTKAQKK